MDIATLDTAVDTSHFKAWDTYNGPLFSYDDMVDGRPATATIYGFHNKTNASMVAFVPSGGAVYGAVIDGHVMLGDGTPVVAGAFFCEPWAMHAILSPGGRLFAVQRTSFLGMRLVGGPIEPAGRLRYIDRCSDSLLIPPPLLGDPCLNHLHFPPGIDQTEHTHPSLRAGCIVRGAGWCETPAGQSALSPGLIWAIPRDGKHNFLTAETELDIIAWHPDSDFGPTHETHPMINRTWVDGRKMDNTGEAHRGAPLVVGDLR